MSPSIPAKEVKLLRSAHMTKKALAISKELPLWLQLNKVSKQYMETLSVRLRGLGIRRHYFLLEAIARNRGKLTQQELADLLETDKVSMVGNLDYLSEFGFIQRQPSRIDRRKHLIVLTPKARRALPEIRKAIAELNQKALNGLPVGIAEHFSEVMRRMKNELAKAASEYRSPAAKSSAAQRSSRRRLSADTPA